jgi:hypothetical protein
LMNMFTNWNQQRYEMSTWTRACEHEHVNKNEYIYNILMTRTKYFCNILCHIRMTWKIFFHIYMDKSHKMDENFGWNLNMNELFGW